MAWFANELITMILDESYSCEDVEAYIHRCRRRDGSCHDLHKRHFLTGRTALIKAVMAGRYRIVAVLLDARVDINAKDHHGNTALHYAVMANSIGLVKLLCSQLIDLEQANQKGLTCLQICVQEKFTDIANFLIQHEANLDTAYLQTNQTLLMTVVMSQDHELMRSLVDHGAELDFKDRITGKTALMHAVCLEDHVAVDYLLQAGANVLAQDHHGLTVWDEALITEDQKLMQKLLAHGAAIGRDLSSETFNMEHFDLRNALLIDAKYDGKVLRSCLDEQGHENFAESIFTIKQYVSARQAGVEFNIAQQGALCHHIFDVPDLRCFDRHTVRDRRAMVAFVLNADHKNMPILKGLEEDVVRVKMDYLTRIGDLLTPLERIAGFVDKMDEKSREAFGDLCMSYTSLSSQAGTLDERQHVYRLVPKDCHARAEAVLNLIEHQYDKTYQETASPVVALRKIEPLYHELGFEFDLDSEINEQESLQDVHVSTASGAHVQLQLYAQILAARQELETQQRNKAYFSRA
jgi:ankyrin repeat protein